MSAGIRIRRAEAADAEGILGLNARLAAEAPHFLAYDIDPVSGAEMLQARLSADDTGDGDGVLVAVDDAAIVGVALLRRHRHPAFAGVLQFSLGVAPERRRAGIGRALIDAAVSAAADAGARRLQLAVIEGNATARRLFEAAGFVLEGRLAGAACIDGAYRDLIAMARPLGGLSARPPSI